MTSSFQRHYVKMSSLKHPVMSSRAQYHKIYFEVISNDGLLLYSSHIELSSLRTACSVSQLSQCSFLHQLPYHALSAQFTAYRSAVCAIYKVLLPHARASVRNCVAEREIKGPGKRGSINILCPVVNGNVISRNLAALLSDEPISRSPSKPLACKTAGNSQD